MNPQVPNSYKNFLPSTKFIKITSIIAIICILVFIVPKGITWLKSRHQNIFNQINTLASLPSTDPTTRDSSGTGIPDWQLIAAGINPRDPNAASEFEKVKKVVGANNFKTAADNATASDKLALVMYDELSQNAIATGSSTSGTVTAVTGTEVANYIQSQQSKNKTYSRTDLTISDDSEASITAYNKKLSQFKDSPFDKDFVTHVTSYIQGKETNVYLTTKLTAINQLVTQLLTTPVPPTALSLHLAILNSLYGLQQTLDSYTLTTSDNLSQLGTVGLAEDYIRSTINNVANLIEYFSVAITPTGSKK
jgi:hypothetical protein